MALFHYLHPVSDSSHGSVSQSVPHGVRAKVKKEIARSVEKHGGRRGSYLSVSAEKAQVATYTLVPTVFALLSSTSARHSVEISRTCIGVFSIACFP